MVAHYLASALVFVVMFACIVWLKRREARARRAFDAQSVALQAADIPVLVERDKRLTQLKDDYFDIIASMQDERDYWREAFFEQSSQHQTAQAMLVRALESARQQSLKIEAVVNQYRKRDGLSVISVVLDPQRPPCTPEQYEQKMKQIADEAPEAADGKTKRDELDAKFRGE